MAVVLILAVLGGVAIPRYLDYRAQAQRSAILGVIGAVQEGIATLQMQYALGNTAGLPPDINGDNFPDDLGDPVRPDTMLFDAVLQQPIPHDDNGWKQYVPLPWPDNPGPVAIYYYHYDADGDNLASSGEVLFAYHRWQGFADVIWVP